MFPVFILTELSNNLLSHKHNPAVICLAFVSNVFLYRMGVALTIGFQPIAVYINLL